MGLGGGRLAYEEALRLARDEAFPLEADSYLHSDLVYACEATAEASTGNLAVARRKALGPIMELASRLEGVTHALRARQNQHVRLCVDRGALCCVAVAGRWHR